MALQPNHGFTEIIAQKEDNCLDLPGKSDERKLFVGALNRSTTDKDLVKHFSKYGNIETATVKRDRISGISRGFAFIAFSNPESIDSVLADKNHYIRGRKVDPKRVYCKSQHGKIFVGGLSPNITHKDIRDYFSQYGTIVDIQTPFDKIKNQNKGFCFVTFDSMRAVDDLLQGVFSKFAHYITGKQVEVKKALVKPETQVVDGRGGSGNVDQVWLPNSGVPGQPWGSFRGGEYASFGSPGAGFVPPQNGGSSFGGGHVANQGGYVSHQVGYGFSEAGYMQGDGTANFTGPALVNYTKWGGYNAYAGFGIDNVEASDASAKPRAALYQRHQPY